MVALARIAVARRALALAVVACAVAVAGTAAHLFRPIPHDLLHERAPAPSSFVLDRQGRVLYEVIDPNAGAYRPIALDEMPKHLLQALIATEDASFYSNPGIDLRGIARALWTNLRSGEVRAGGSTITQQLARSILMEEGARYQRTWNRKAREAVLAWRLTRTLSKDEILTLYLNRVYFGNLAYGVDAAARTYFGKPVAQLGLAECALLAGLPQAPALYNPLVDLDAALDRQRVVLDRMVDAGYLSSERAALAYREPLRLASTPFPIEAPHFVMFVLQKVMAELGDEALRGGGLRIHTTLDLDLQRAAEGHVARHLADLNGGERDAPQADNAAALVLDPRDGAILVMVGGPDYFDAEISGAVNGSLGLRQPGSSIKPITYAAAFEMGYAPGSVIYDVPSSFTTREGQPYMPINYDLRFHGPVSLRTALASSYNVSAVKLLSEIGIAAFADLAQRLGITSLQDADRYGLALTLGSGEVSLLELTSAYGAFASGGLAVRPYAVSEVRGPGGQVLYHQAPSPGPRVLDAAVAYLVTDVLADPQARVAAFGIDSPLDTPFGAAVKTGTTTEWRDNWTVGYTREAVVGVWVGNADNRPMRNVSGVAGAAPIWRATMMSVHRQPPAPFERPAELVEVEVCTDSGLLPGPACPHRRRELFLAGQAPTQVCDLHRFVEVDSATGYLAGPNTPPEQRVTRRVIDWPAEVLQWAIDSRLPMPPQPPPTAVAAAEPGRVGEAVTPQTSETTPYLIAPGDGAIYCLAGELPAAYQQVEVVAVAPSGGSLTLLVDGIARHTWSGPPYRIFWPLEVGAHALNVQPADAPGAHQRSAPIRITVLATCQGKGAQP